MSEFVVERGVEIPHTNYGRKSPYPDNLRVGESFFVPEPNRDQARKRSANLGQFMYKTYGAGRYAVRVVEGAVLGVRCWRI